MPRPFASMMPGVLAGAALVLLGLGGLWAWQSWSHRVSEPIDDRLPMLRVTAEESVAVEPAQAISDQGAAGGAVTNIADADPNQSESLPAAAPIVEAPSIIVHVAGAVRQAGVVDLDADARVIDALQAAGGATAGADLDRVNLAAPVMDGERIHVPTIGEDAVPIVVSTMGQTSTSAAGQVVEPLMLDLNTVSAELLEELPGVGPSTAAAIVRTRESRGPFRAVQELLEVPGIGEAKLSQIEPFVQVGG